MVARHCKNVNSCLRTNRSFRKRVYLWACLMCFFLTVSDWVMFTLEGGGGHLCLTWWVAVCWQNAQSHLRSFIVSCIAGHDLNIKIRRTLSSLSHMRVSNSIQSEQLTHSLICFYSFLKIYYLFSIMHYSVWFEETTVRPVLHVLFNVIQIWWEIVLLSFIIDIICYLIAMLGMKMWLSSLYVHKWIIHVK